MNKEGKMLSLAGKKNKERKERTLQKCFFPHELLRWEQRRTTASVKDQSRADCRWGLGVQRHLFGDLILELERQLFGDGGSSSYDPNRPLLGSSWQEAAMWSKLPEDILTLIFATLEFPDLVRAASVCPSWHGAYATLFNLRLWKKQQTPCLLYTFEPPSADSTAGLYSITEKKPYTLSLPDPPIRGQNFIGSAYGWIITADERSELHLLNPITGDQIALPSITTIKQVTPICDENGVVNGYHSWAAMDRESDPPDVFRLDELRDYFFQKVFLSSDPSTGSYIVVLIHNTQYQLSFARAGDDCWTPLPPHKLLTDCIFKDNLMYGLTMHGEIIEFDFNDPSVKQKVLLDIVRHYSNDNAMHIVQTPCGDLLQIWWDYMLLRKGRDVSQLDLNSLEEDDDNSETETESYSEPHRFCSILPEVYRVNLTSNERVQITSLGENFLFLGKNQSLCLRAQDHPQLKANHIYITDLDPYTPVVRKFGERDIAVINLGNNSREEIVRPQLWSNWPSPMWITPNLRKAKLGPGRNT